jgi:FixJ family two-component response regulator
VASFASVKAYQDSGHTEQPDCLILDVCLPGRSGLDFQADLLKAGSRYPIIFISGHADVQMSVRAMKAGAIEFLTKPVRHQDLLSAVDMAVNA